MNVTSALERQNELQQRKNHATPRKLKGRSLLSVCRGATCAIQSFCKQFPITPCTLLTAGGACRPSQSCSSSGACTTAVFHRLMANTIGVQMSNNTSGPKQNHATKLCSGIRWCSGHTATNQQAISQTGVILNSFWEDFGQSYAPPARRRMQQDTSLLESIAGKHRDNTLKMLSRGFFNRQEHLVSELGKYYE